MISSPKMQIIIPLVYLLLFNARDLKFWRERKKRKGRDTKRPRDRQTNTERDRQKHEQEERYADGDCNKGLINNGIIILY